MADLVLATLKASIALSTPIRDLDFLFIHAKCGCKSAVQPIGPLVRRGVQGTLGDVLRRMRCATCRQHPSDVVLADSVHAPRRPGDTKLSSAPSDLWWIKLDPPI